MSVQRPDDLWTVGAGFAGGNTVTNPIQINRCKNTSGEVVPPSSVMVVSSMDANAIRQCIKPDASSSSNIVFTPNRPIGVNQEFDAVAPSDVLVTINGTPAIGDGVGTVSGQWYLDTSETGFICNGFNASLGVARVVPFSSCELTTTTATFTGAPLTVAPPALSAESPWLPLSSPLVIPSVANDQSVHAFGGQSIFMSYNAHFTAFVIAHMDFKTADETIYNALLSSQALEMSSPGSIGAFGRPVFTGSNIQFVGGDPLISVRLRIVLSNANPDYARLDSGSGQSTIHILIHQYL